MEFLSLGGLTFTDQPQALQSVTIRTGPGDKDFVNVLLGDFRSFMTEVVNQRIDDLAEGIGGSTGPSIWPTPRTMNLTGIVGGSVTFDGSADFSLTATIADGALSIAKTAGLQTVLDGKLSSGAAAVSANKLTTARNIALTGLVTGTGSFDGSTNLSITTAIADGALSIAKTSGLATALDNKFDKAGGPISGPIGITDGWTALSTTTGASLRAANKSFRFLPGSDVLGTNIITFDGYDGNTRAAFPESAAATLEWAYPNMSLAGNQVYHTGNLNAASMGYLGAGVTQYGSGAGADCNTFAAGLKALVHNTNLNTPGASSPYWYIETLLIGDTGSNYIQRAYSNTSDEIYFRRCNAGAWGNWRRLWNSSNLDPTQKLGINDTAATATKLLTARAINGTTFDGTAAITTALWGTARNFTIGDTLKSVNGSANVAWTLDEIGVPSKTGVGASGTWPVSITGTATGIVPGGTVDEYIRGDGSRATLPAGRGMLWQSVFNADVNPALTDTGYDMITGGVLRQVFLPDNLDESYYVSVRATDGPVRIVAGANVISDIGPGNNLLMDPSSTVTLVGREEGVVDILQGVTPIEDSKIRIVSEIVGGVITPTSNTDMVRPASLTANLTIANPSSPPADGDGFIISLISTGTFALTWGSMYVDEMGVLPTATVAGKRHRISVEYNAVDDKLYCTFAGRQA